jgi:hypothetical protein
VGELRVQPASLGAAGGSLASTGDDVSGLSQVVGTVSAVGPSTGDGAAAAALEQMCGVWAGELERVGQQVSSVGRLAVQAGRLYEWVDQTAIPGSAKAD